MLTRNLPHTFFGSFFVEINISRLQIIKRDINQVVHSNNIKNNNKPSGYWNNENNILIFLQELKKKLNYNSPEDWNSLTKNQIKENGGRSLLDKFSMYKIKCLACPEGKSIFTESSVIKKPIGYWNNEENVKNLLNKLKIKLNLNTFEDWEALTTQKIQIYSDGNILSKYSLYDLKCIGFPDGKLNFTKKIEYKPPGFWNEENIKLFLQDIKEKYNFNTPEDWNSLTWKQIRSNGGSSLLHNYSIYDLKALACPEGIHLFKLSPKPNKYWENEENVKKFLKNVKEKLNLQTAEDWKQISSKQIQSFGGNTLFKKYSLYDLQCLGCKEENLEFEKNEKIKQNKPFGYWNNKENIINFFKEFNKSFNYKTIDDWNSLTLKQIQLHGGKSLIMKYSLYDLKCFACPEGKLEFDKSISYKPTGYWDDESNVHQFLNELKEKYNLKTVKDWNKLKRKQIQLHGGRSLFDKYSLYDLKCLACPEGKSEFDKPVSYKPTGFWDDESNVLQFLNELKEKYNLNTPEDWNFITRQHFQANGAGSILHKYSMFELKCLGCPEGKSLFTPSPKPFKPQGFWNDEENILRFLDTLQERLKLKTIEDWRRLSKAQIRAFGGEGLATKLSLQQIVDLKFPNLNLINSGNKRSSQRWLFLQIKKLFPGEEIVEDYFHSDISRDSGFPVQFDIFLIDRKIAIEYHGKHHYEDMPFAFSPIEMYKNRDNEKEKLCLKYGIKLIVIPYWWDNNLDSLRAVVTSHITE